MPFADQMRAQLGKFAFAELRKSLKQFLARDERQYRVTQKFELLVITDFVFAVRSRMLGFLLARLGTMRDRLFNDGTPPEVVAERRFQLRYFPFFHAGFTASLRRNLT